MNKQKILLVDDDLNVLNALNDLFLDDYTTILASSGGEAIELYKSTHNIAVVILDIKMPVMDGIETGRKLRKIKNDIAIIFHTGYPGDYEEDYISEEEKPYDFILKGNSIEKLKRSVKNAVDSYILKNNIDLTKVDSEHFGFIGDSLKMKGIYQLIRKVATNDSKVMIYGETGTGKELVARAIHNCGKRSNNKLAILNCNHKSADLIESELFGHTKGSFTGAINDRIGLFEYANGGTLFLDEIGDLDVTTQAKLLRVVETGEYSPIGLPNPRFTDVRIICATHKDLIQLVKEKLFREDLYFRLKGIVIKLPPLRDRKEDIPLLIESYKDKITYENGLPLKVFDQSAMNLLIEYDWPGNVRELFEAIESILVISESDLIFADDIKKILHISGYELEDSRLKLSDRLREIEKTLIIESLIESKNNISKAADLLQMDRSNLHKKIKFHKINISNN